MIYVLLLAVSFVLFFIFFLKTLEAYTSIYRPVSKILIGALIVSFGLVITFLFLLDKYVEPTQESIQIDECIKREDCVLRNVLQRCYLKEDGTIKECHVVED